MARPGLIALFLLFILMPVQAAAHKPSDSYLSLDVQDSSVEGRWDMALRDLDHAIGLDGDGDGAITWGELQTRHGAVTAYALARLEIKSDARVCPAVATDHLVDNHSDGAYAVLRFTATCATPIDDLGVAYSLLFDLDPLHRGLLQVNHGGRNYTTVLGPERSTWSLLAADSGLWRQFLVYLEEGVWHIWSGFDHILFLISLLLPAVLRRRDGAWVPARSPRAASIGVLKIVTAFTVAHSITLGLATLGWLDLPSRLVETVIAASIVIAALNNLYPIVSRGLWAVAFGFGLIHGVGFAGALQALGLPSTGLLLSLFSFNLGVEIGQMAIVAGFLPLAFWAGRTPLYPRLVLRFGSLGIAAVASLWLVERTFSFTLPVL